MSAFKHIAKGFGFGLQGGLDQVITNTFMGVVKGTAGVLHGVARGAAGAGANLSNKTMMGKITGGLGYGIGTVVGRPIVPIVGLMADVGKSIIKSAPGDAKRITELGGKLIKSMTTETNDGYREMGIGLFGKRIKKPVAWGMTAGAIGLGLAGSAEDQPYNLALKTTVNGIMDTQGVATTPGSVNQTYIPVHRQRGVNNHGAVGGLGFALHNARRG